MKEPVSIEKLSEFLSHSGIRIRLNLITQVPEVEGLPSIYNPETLENDLPIIIRNDLKEKGIYCTKNECADLLGVIAGINRYNPVIDLLEKDPWDGVSRINDLYDILHISDDLSKTLIKKWLQQSIALLYNDPSNPYGPDGMLVIVGPQGIGKTQFVRRLGFDSRWVKLGQWIDTRDKDTSRRCISAWIVELGEVETTMRTDQERLKAFITNELDEFRIPFGRTDQKRARRTSLIATCNSSRFLVDTTGSRRYWTVPVEEIDLDRLAEFNMLQLWREIKMAVDENRQCFRLTEEERDQLAKRNGLHERPLKGQQEVEDILACAGQNKAAWTWRYATTTEFISAHPSLRRYSAEDIGKVLTKLIGKPERKKFDGNAKNIRRLPFPVASDFTQNSFSGDKR